MKRGIGFAVALAGCSLMVVGCGNDANQGGDDLTMMGHADLVMGGQDAPAPTDAAEDANVGDAGGGDALGPQPDMVPEVDATCANTPQSCGMPGACADCTNSPSGNQCVNNACGCNSQADCPMGNACDPNTHACSGSCANGLSCNGGCCDGQKCVAGTDNAACGTAGGACVACADGTPTCTNGACTSTCVVGMGGGNCGNGFCCDANNTCQAIGNNACGAPGAACADCAMSQAGNQCIKGACGCNTQADCPNGQACTNGACGTACSMNSPCNGGCCNNGTCAAGNTGAACAVTNGAPLCSSCTMNNNGHACVTANNMTFCGCNTSADCPANTACNTTTHQCGNACDMNTPCNGGCCSAALGNTCVSGVALQMCGNNGGMCSDCTTNNNGHVCNAVNGGGQCGCTTVANCPMGATGCVNGICSFQCGMVNNMMVTCPNGCCGNIVNGVGTCQPGTAQNACGAPMTNCANCTMNANGTACRPPGVCGCNAAADCPMGQACNTTTHVCSTTCGGGFTACNGGCCAGNTCVGGTMGNACGNNGNMCVSCTMNNNGHACVVVNNAAICGCNAAADCPVDRACNTTTHQCTDQCNGNQPCNGGCCNNGVCNPGTANNACGNNGGACAACTNGTPSCVAGACTDACGGMGNGTCGGGHCCSAGHCVDGSQQTTCGFQGVCTNCQGISNGSKCETGNQNGPWFCGCDQAGDCLAANPLTNAPGQACDTQAHSCTNRCRIQGVTLCNGGCCTGDNGFCVGGGADNACGVSGGICNSCASCQPGPHCNPNNGSCGCGPQAQCNLNNTMACYANGANRYGCNYNTSACCIPGVAGFTDNGNPANCCTGMSAPCGNANCCTCVANGMPSGGDLWNCCSLRVDNNNNCACIPTNSQCFGSDAACCSGHCRQTFNGLVCTAA